MSIVINAQLLLQIMIASTWLINRQTSR